MTKVLFILGTRPEAIKLSMLYKLLKASEAFELELCNTGQHNELIKPFLKLFGMKADYVLDTMEKGDTLNKKLSFLLDSLETVIDESKTDLVVVQGDTLSCYAGALAAFHQKVKIVHIEAGLRTGNKYAPYPEEMYRIMTDSLADFRFAPTQSAMDNLEKEGLHKHNYLTGNTGTDALLYTKEKINAGEYRRNTQLLDLVKKLKSSGKSLITLTLHRREILGDKMNAIFQALDKTAEDLTLEIIFPVHYNPNVRKSVDEILKKSGHCHIINPLSYQDFIWLMLQSDLIITDSGGIQEEAPALGRKVLVIRDETERNETIKEGGVLAGTDASHISSRVIEMLEQPAAAQQFHYGNGDASQKIIEVLTREFS